MVLMYLTTLLAATLALSNGEPSGYQLESESQSQCELLREAKGASSGGHVPQCSEDGQFRQVQCSAGASECWCVDAEGEELPGSRQNGSAIHCLSPCQLQRQRVLQGANDGDAGGLLPMCTPNGQYQEVQCDPATRQCWCVDHEGMEIYGTRQNGRPARCPSVCKIRERRVLHGVGDPSPPQCSADGNFLPVQCKFINTSDSTTLDLLSTFNRHPELFQSFSGFRKTFPLVASYCYCADRRGRELPNTGLELLLSEVYDTAFSDSGPGHTFAQSNMFRILQRRFLAVHLALTGRFRCPTPCESERAAASKTGAVFVPSCDANGHYVPTQCQEGGQCWCVDTHGNELPGTRQLGTSNCSAGLGSCGVARQRALSRLFSGPATVPEIEVAVDPVSICSPQFQELLAKSGFLRALSASNLPEVGDIMAEAVQGIFPSGGAVLKALGHAPNPSRLQENLFGGKILKMAALFNFSGALGTRGTMRLQDVLRQTGTALDEPQLERLATMFAPGVGLPTAMAERGGAGPGQVVIDPASGRAVNLTTNRQLVQLLSATLESESFLAALREAIVLLGAQESTRLDDLVRALFRSSGPDECQTPASLYVPQCDHNGHYADVQCSGTQCWCVDPQGDEVKGSRTLGSRPRCPSQCEMERAAAILAKSSMSAGAQVFLPRCEEGGAYVPRQCLGRSCFCVDPTGNRIVSPTSGAQPLQCPTDCQASATQAFLRIVQSVLSDPSSVSRLSDVYVPRCMSDGSWHQVQCDGPPAAAFQFHQEWEKHNNDGLDLPVHQLLALLRGYRNNPVAMASFRGFLSALFQANHQKAFPMLRAFTSLDKLPEGVAEGQPEMLIGPSVFLNPLSLWTLLSGGASSYPGSLLDFSLPLSHTHLRQCWCVNPAGDILPNTRTEINQVPQCPGPCALATKEVVQFLATADDIISSSNLSHVPAGFGYLLAQGLHLSPQELMLQTSPLPPPPALALLTQALRPHSSSALRLAAHSMLHFYWQSRIMAMSQDKESLLLGYQPYHPQCDSEGYWLPKQCHLSTGQCWCVDEEGRYISDSLTSYSSKPSQCPTSCQQAQSLSALSHWLRPTSDITSSYRPNCDGSGLFSVLQASGEVGSSSWCVDPASGHVLQPAITTPPDNQSKCPVWCALQKGRAVAREAGVGFEAVCEQDGGVFAPLQCDTHDCWCVSDDSGLELPHTRTPRVDGVTPSCDRPQCPLAFGASRLPHGAVVCQPDQQGQRCFIECHQGFVNVLPAMAFLCDPESRKWLSGAPLANACQQPQAFQTVSSKVSLPLVLQEGQRSCDQQHSQIQSSLLQDMRARGMCSLQESGAQVSNSVSVCGESSVLVECVSENQMIVHVTLFTHLSDLPTGSLPDLHNIDMALNSEKLLASLQDLMGAEPYQSLLSSNHEEAVLFNPTFNCAAGFQKVLQGGGCVVCPAGSFSRGSSCSLCPRGSYQDGLGQPSCLPCPPGSFSTTPGASSTAHCLTPCQESGLSCTREGDFLPSQEDRPSGTWQCVSANGEPLPWTSSQQPITEQDCKVLRSFEVVPDSQLLFSSQDALLLRSDVETLPVETLVRKCVLDCAVDPSCQHVALFTTEGQTHCDIYSTATANGECVPSPPTQGFLGNPEAELHQSLSCPLVVRQERRPGQIVLRKKGHEFLGVFGTKTLERLTFRKAGAGVYRSLVFSTAVGSGPTLAHVHRYCTHTCSLDDCCHGFILNQNILNGGSIMCGLLRDVNLLQCEDGDWDVVGSGRSSRVCGAGIQYSKHNKRFVFQFGGQLFNITDAALPASSKNKSDYQASIIGFQRIYMWKESDVMVTSTCSTNQTTTTTITPQLLSDEVLRSFSMLSVEEVEEEVEVRSGGDDALPRQHYRLFKQHFPFQQAQRWCLKRCEEEELCHLSDVRDEGTLYWLCVLYPDTRVCGAYDKPLRQACRLQLPQAPQTAHRKIVDFSGSVKSFYTRVSFRKMVSYSVRSRLSLGDKPIHQGFMECERRCDEDPCCRGIGYVRDSASSSSSGGEVLCLTLNSLGIQTCEEEGEGDGRSGWNVQDCRPSQVETHTHPFGWYQKPVSQWTSSPALCPTFNLRAPSTNVSLLDWQLLDVSAVKVDKSISRFDVVHISKDIAGDQERVRDWCLAACGESVSCVAVSQESRDSASRCIFYPDTHTCVPTERTHKCQLSIKEPAALVYLRTAPSRSVQLSVEVSGHGRVQGVSMVTAVGMVRRRVLRFLGVPYARPPTAALRFTHPQPATWTGTWDASFHRPSCVQPGVSSGSSEDCLYLNIFTPVGMVDAPVLVFFHNPSPPPTPTSTSSSQGAGLLDGSYLAAVGNIVVVTASYREAAFGFLVTGSGDEQVNVGLMDQVSVLKWVQNHIAAFGGDPHRVTMAAERGGANIASLHLISSSSASLFQRAILMGGSLFSPATVQSMSQALNQSVALGNEMGCPSSDSAQLLSCLRTAPADVINAAQTKLLAVSGPLQAWSAVVDGVSVAEDPSSSLQRLRFHDLLLGTSAEDGLISRARNIKRFEELQGRTDGKTAFYEALVRSLGGAKANVLVKEAANWFYSLHHAPNPAGYNLFSRALENATRDLFIICPSKKMADIWATNSRSHVYMYHLPQDMTHTSVDVSLPLDVQLMFGVPHHPPTQQLFTMQDRRLSTHTMTYMGNFIRRGNPNGADPLPSWPRVLAASSGDNHKLLTVALGNERHLRTAECSFWNDYVPLLTHLTADLSLSATGSEGTPPTRPPSPPLPKLILPPQEDASSNTPKTQKDTYN